MRNRAAILVLAVMLVVGSIVHADQAQTPLTMAGVPNLVITAVAQDVEVLATDAGSVPSKRAQVIKFTDVDEREFVLLVRLQRSGNGLFLDLVPEATIGELTTRVNALAITGSAHPSPGEDTVDAAVLAAAAGE